LNIVLVASKQDHGPGQHDYPAWQKKWNEMLASAGGVIVTNAWLWPTTDQFQTADLLLFYYWNHDWNAERYRQLDDYLRRGGGMVVLHSAYSGRSRTVAARIGFSAQPPGAVPARSSRYQNHRNQPCDHRRGCRQYLL
jgi:hypothetical protein